MRELGLTQTHAFAFASEYLQRFRRKSIFMLPLSFTLMSGAYACRIIGHYRPWALGIYMA